MSSNARVLTTERLAVGSQQAIKLQIKMGGTPLEDLPTIVLVVQGLREVYHGSRSGQIEGPTVRFARQC